MNADLIDPVKVEDVRDADGNVLRIGDLVQMIGSGRPPETVVGFGGTAGYFPPEGVTVAVHKSNGCFDWPRDLRKVSAGPAGDLESRDRAETVGLKPSEEPQPAAPEPEWHGPRLNECTWCFATQNLVADGDCFICVYCKHRHEVTCTLNPETQDYVETAMLMPAQPEPYEDGDVFSLPSSEWP